MGGTNSKAEKTEALKMCKLRKKMIKQAIDSRYSIAAAHISYIQSLKNIGVALRRFAEAEVLLESSSSPSGTTNVTEIDKSPSHHSHSPSPSHVSENPRLSYMKSGGNNNNNVGVTFRYNPSTNAHTLVDCGNKNNVIQDDVEFTTVYENHRVNFMKTGENNNVGVNFRYNPSTNTHSLVDRSNNNDINNNGNEEEEGIVLPPPPPPPPDCGTWDYFDTGCGEEGESFRFVGMNETSVNASVSKSESIRMFGGEVGNVQKSENGKGLMVGVSSSKIDSSKGEMEELEEEEEREDASEFITHRAKDFLSSIKDIEHRFFRASECGKDVARMLEANRIRVGYADAKGSLSPLDSLAAYPLVCCRGKSVHASNEHQQQSAPKVIIWNRSMSSHSSSSRNPLATASKDDTDDSGSEHVEDFFMISGSHSSTLDRLYAWERKLYDEVKASEAIRKVYDKKCIHLRHQFAKDHSTHVIDKTRSAVKDLHSRIRVALHAVDSIAKRIEKMRDEELLPQLIELITGFIRMWKAMLECHHAQYITISLAYHAKTSVGTTAGGGDTRKEITTQLQYEFECFGLSFADWMNSHTSYVEALNGWLQNCVMQTQERSRGSHRKPFSPRRVLAPPIFVLCRDWSVGIRALPAEDVSDAIRNFLTNLHLLAKQQQEDENKETGSRENEEGKDEDQKRDANSANLGGIHTSLTKVLDKLTKFSEASLKLYEDIRQKCEIARVAYSKPRPFRY
ncbi:hypothetical protein RND81_06G027200 [Saponaria officinalis]|uniref:Uncharacterized protein n=1 Tax=Saponaria officinalis TaxID=3572 RepID=A0AAW1K6M9_SAPOF